MAFCGATRFARNARRYGWPIPIVEPLAQEHQGSLKVAKVDVDANQGVATRYNIRSIPSILFFKDGKHVDTVVGAVPKSILDRKIAEHMG